MLSEKSARRALLHLTTMGDTDIFPSPFEFHFYRDQSDKIIESVTKLEFGNYLPRGCVELLSPKGSLSFRIAHQLYPADTVIYTAAAIEIAEPLEALRATPACGPFSYRFLNDENNPRLFSETSGYHDWIEHLQDMYGSISGFGKKKHRVVETDISDFYSRIYFHRIEHVLDDVKAASSVRKIIEGIIKFSRGRQSYGLPVGTAASRILAEGLLIDTDSMICDEAKKFSRYVDDFRIVATSEIDAHSILCDLAQHLMLTEGLSLNSSKTRIRTLEGGVEDTQQKLGDVFHDQDIVEVNRYIRRVYDDEDVSVEEISDVEPEKIVGKIREVLSRDAVDYGIVRVLLRALRATGAENPVKIVAEFGSLLYYLPRDFCLMIGALAQRNPESADAMADAVLAEVAKPPVNQMALTKIWVAHLFVAQALPITTERLKSLRLADSSLERRAFLLLKGLLKHRAFFRSQKTSFSESSDWAKSALLFGASCMSVSEYDKWLDTIKSHYSDPFSAIYLKWLKNNQAGLYDRLKEDFKIQSRTEKLVAQFEALDDDAPF